MKTKGELVFNTQFEGFKRPKKREMLYDEETTDSNLLTSSDKIHLLIPLEPPKYALITKPPFLGRPIIQCILKVSLDI